MTFGSNTRSKKSRCLRAIRRGPIQTLTTAPTFVAPYFYSALLLCLPESSLSLSLSSRLFQTPTSIAPNFYSPLLL